MLLVPGITGVVLFSNVLYLQAEEYEYDALNRVTKVSYEDGSYVEYEYDSNGNILNVNVYHARPTPAPDTEQGSEETESTPDEETGETTPDESESDNQSSGAGDESTNQPEESESGTDDTIQDETEKSEVREFIEQAIEAVKEIFNAITQWFKAWFS